MRALLVLLLGAIVTGGCGKPSGQPPRVQALIDSWAEMGMYLPDDEQVQFLHANLADVQPELAAALSHENPEVRQRAAYVVAEIGQDAHALGDSLLEQLKKESEQLVQIYLVDALGAVRFDSNETVAYLSSKYDSLSSENAPGSGNGAYTEVDEKINLAGVLSVLGPPETRQRYRDFVIKWLRSPDDELSPSQLEGYWERRWMAVNSLESMPDTPEAIPLLEAMLDEETSKSWAPVHVPRVLAVLKRERADE